MRQRRSPPAPAVSAGAESVGHGPARRNDGSVLGVDPRRTGDPERREPVQGRRGL